MTKRILVIGCSGQLGQSLKKIAHEAPAWEWVWVDRTQLDLASAESIGAFFSSQDPFDYIVNAAAYTAVDRAETEPELAEQVNHVAVAQLAAIAEKQKAFLVHVSTDYVFNGQQYRPYLETDPVAPINIYGATKRRGEEALLASSGRGAIVRTSWVYSEFGHNFVKTMLRLGHERQSLTIVADQIGSPTYALDLARACLTLCQQAPLEPGFTLYHLSNNGVCSWYDFAHAIFELANIKCRVHPIESKDYPTPAARPHYSVLNLSKIRAVQQVNTRHWREALQECLLHFSQS